MMAENGQDKTEQPTSFRLQEARDKGQVPRSTELSGVMVTVIFSIALMACGYTLAAAWARAFRRTLLMAGNAPTPSAGLVHWLQGTFQPTWQALVPVVLAMVVAAVVANIVQTGPTFSTTPLKPDFSRLNPAQGFTRVFSRRMLWDLLKLSFKVAVLGAMAWAAASSIEHRVQAAAASAPSSMGLLLRSIYVQVTVWVLTLLVAVALLDLIFSRREYIRKLRMSRSDIKDEGKRREGDPDIRHKRKRLMAELLKHARSVRKVPDADIVLTNPTHLAIALQYRPNTMRSPIVLSKGADAVAAQMRSAAARAGVPCLRSPELARALFRECRVDQTVPAHLYTQLAPIYRWLMKRPGTRIFS
ncbi:EscU/YscU/HrcU family type III secretion system export apparatus switch protein [Dyella tabacisoli]|uniref:Flagellar type III secretion system protein FlhB n=1 Tax=Dyella tabacisoli TaxID=2282381 RepID=A0A369ULJ8_9GAMM|nr:EscU/YscU/HrcU family type III secretion system export apparatus switch protein [Dyella tabacisoli]RDD81456.1 flagellar type III secretion system protein FlhB [Dyella tabacisoli]